MRYFLSLKHFSNPRKGLGGGGEVGGGRGGGGGGGGGGGVRPTTHGNGGLFWRVENLVFVSLYTSFRELQFPDIAVRVRFLIYQVWMIDFLSIIE